MAIAGPESNWRKFRRTTALFDLWGAAITAGGLAVSSARFFATNEPRWGWLMATLALSALVLQAFKANATYREQVRKDSVHELRGCLQTLETVLLGPDLEPNRRLAVGLRLTIHIPDGKGHLIQA